MNGVSGVSIESQTIQTFSEAGVSPTGCLKPPSSQVKQELTTDAVQASLVYPESRSIEASSSQSVTNGQERTMNQCIGTDDVESRPEELAMCSVATEVKTEDGIKYIVMNLPYVYMDNAAAKDEVQSVS